MSAYAVGLLRDARMGEDLVDYLEHIDETLAPHGGRFIIHGAQPEVLEGEWDDDLIVIEFPTLEAARRWYYSPNYQWLLPLRIANSSGTVALLEGVGAGHRATDILEKPGGTGRSPVRQDADRVDDTEAPHREQSAPSDRKGASTA